MNQILVSGATGFVGKCLCSRLLKEGLDVRGTILSSEIPSSLAAGVEPITVEPLSECSRWDQALVGVNTVIHLAARVHVMRETSSDPLLEFRKVNTDGAENLARQAAAAGVRRFVFMSTVGVNGDNSGSTSYTETDEPHPHNPYSISKLEAEDKLRELSFEYGIELVVIRAPLVYGAGNPGNFLSLLHAVHKRLPLPLASISNKRSLIYVGNLTDALALCARHPAAAGKTYLVSDGEDVSTPELIRMTATALGVPPRLFPVPVPLMKLAGVLAGKSGTVNRLTGSLTVDSSKIKQELRWHPPFTVQEGLQATAKWYLELMASERNSSPWK